MKIDERETPQVDTLNNQIQVGKHAGLEYFAMRKLAHTLERERDAAVEALRNDRNLLAHYYTTFSDRRFTDRYGDAGRCKNAVTRIDALLAELDERERA